MLNETYLLRQALGRAQVEIPRQHPRVKTPGSSAGPCLRVRLDQEGGVTAIETMTEEERPGLWTVMEGNHNSFPVVRASKPLCDISTEREIWKKLGFDAEGKRKKKPSEPTRISALTDTLGNRCKICTQQEPLWRRLRDKADELLRHVKGSDPEDETLREFVRRFRKAGNNLHTLFRKISECALTSVKSARLDDLDTVETLLVGKGPPKDDGKPPTMLVQLAFDLASSPDFSRRLYSQEIKERVKRTLPVEQRSSEDNHPAPACAYTGKEQPLQVSPFPKVKLPVLNKDFPLVSMFSDAACNRRYGLTDSSIVPVAKDVALKTQDALTWIVAEERQGKTWRGVANGRFETVRGRKTERSDLLIVYVDGKPEIDANLADIFGSDEEKQFEVDAKTVCDALEGVERERPGSKLNIFLMRKASEGQAQVVVAESPSVADILNAAKWWQQASANVPKVKLPLPGKKGSPAILASPKPPYPDQVVRLLSEEWVANGTRSNKVNGVGLGDVLALMLRTPGKWKLAQSMLDLAVRRFGPLLSGVFGAMYTGDARRRDKYPMQSRKTALRAVSTLGILLDAVDRRKESYMGETAFLVGRVLSLADTLHREYCKHVRDGSIPPQLIGNALMPVAADNPVDALDRLRERMMPYKAWTDRDNGSDSRLAKWAVGRIGEICSQLHQLSPSPQTDQTFRAELFLGYMARPPAEKNADDNNPHK